MPTGVTEISREVHSLHMIIFAICVVIAVVVFGVMFWSLIRYRRSRNKDAAHFHESTAVELIWTAVPVVILIAMAVPATATLKKIYDPSDAQVDVLITGYQWRWRYEFLNEDVAYFSNLSTPLEQIEGQQAKGEAYLLEVDEPLVLPVDTKVRFLLTSNDVIHAWWVPELAVKKDAVPGFINESWTNIEQPGTYRGQCAELCGRNHGFMPVEVKAVSQQEFQTFLDEKRALALAEKAKESKQWSMAELMEKGEAVYTTYCAACHQPNGQGLPPAFPALAGNDNMISASGLDIHIERVLYGKSGTAMPGFAETLSAVDIAAVVTYERNAWGNDTGDAIQPEQINQILTAEE
ncbi:cytochrome c oxidase subunit II [Bacterioplanes sanyensis]|uniref:Cytochrome c oxidase subunit 2 n=2 Tax=Bacterioplanes sanyensis TaxID=1249553 RepID=A0A222FRA3_9GAMM|nr:cytochrome c oxidase subunit II [Bacterioplanes sanyensis]